MIADPEFPNKARDGREDEIRRCTRCYHCYPGMPELPWDDKATLVPDMTSPPTNILRGRGLGRCSINPVSGNQVDIDDLPEPGGSRNVLVVGGGPGGMQAAITAADRGHRVTLVEKDISLGGVVRFTDTDLHKVDLRDFKDLLVREVGRRDIKVRLNTEATPELIADSKPDAVILAIGASPCMPATPGLDTAMHVLDVYKDDSRIGKKVVIVGGGLSGCETALHLADKGHEVTIVEMLENLATEATGMALTATILQIEKRDITVKTGAKCIEITPKGVKVENASGETEVIECDTVVHSLGMEAKRAETESLRAAAGDASVFEVGDCVRGAKVYEAISEGFMAAMEVI
jgi:pyruvate/2-oxoglutarate dehydrogenase complex dihydrolipoamide dehydrogenase (E3) component